MIWIYSHNFVTLVSEQEKNVSLSTILLHSTHEYKFNKNPKVTSLWVLPVHRSGVLSLLQTLEVWWC